MKKLIYLIILLVIFSACHKHHKTGAKESQTRQQTEVTEKGADSTLVDEHDTMPEYNGQEYNTAVTDYDYTAPYICPNHCPGSGSDKPGKCPVCGMDLIPNPDCQKK